LHVGKIGGVRAPRVKGSGHPDWSKGGAKEVAEQPGVEGSGTRTGQRAGGLVAVEAGQPRVAARAPRGKGQRPTGWPGAWGGG